MRGSTRESAVKENTSKRIAGLFVARSAPAGRAARAAHGNIDAKSLLENRLTCSQKKSSFMPQIIKLAAAVMCVLIAAPLWARAQVVSLAPPDQGAAQGWTYAATPYLWMPSINASLGAKGPRGTVVNASTSAGFGAILSHLNFALMGGAAARYDRFSVMTDLVYVNVSLTTSNSHLSTFNPGPGPIYIPRSQQLDTGTRLTNTIWSLAGGYTLLQGDWGNLDGIAGMRLLSMNSTTNLGLRADIYLPNRTIGLSRNGSAKVNEVYVEGVGGITGRINFPNSKFYVPYYFDAGGGALPFTWQTYVALAYKMSSWSDVSAGYRYLRFENGNASTGLRDIAISGALIALNCHF